MASGWRVAARPKASWPYKPNLLAARYHNLHGTGTHVYYIAMAPPPLANSHLHMYERCCPAGLDPDDGQADSVPRAVRAVPSSPECQLLPFLDCPPRGECHGREHKAPAPHNGHLQRAAITAAMCRVMVVHVQGSAGGGKARQASSSCVYRYLPMLRPAHGTSEVPVSPSNDARFNMAVPTPGCCDQVQGMSK
jgi:hypothetical protein